MFLVLILLSSYYSDLFGQCLQYVCLCIILKYGWKMILHAEGFTVNFFWLTTIIKAGGVVIAVIRQRFISFFLPNCNSPDFEQNNINTFNRNLLQPFLQKGMRCFPGQGALSTIVDPGASATSQCTLKSHHLPQIVTISIFCMTWPGHNPCWVGYN